MKKKTLLITNLLIIIIIIFLELKFNNKLTSYDLVVSNIIWGIRTPLLTSIMKIISFLASTKFIIVVLIIYIFIHRDVYFPLNMSISTIINTVLKRIIKRSRPSNILVIEKSYSFPSGHSMASMSFYGYIIYKVIESKINKSYKIALTLFFSILILLVGFSRIYLGAHYLSDVICGYLISLEYLVIYITILKNVTKK